MVKSKTAGGKAVKSKTVSSKTGKSKSARGRTAKDTTAESKTRRARTRKKSRVREPADLKAHIKKALELGDNLDTSRIYRMAKYLFDPQIMYGERIDTDRPSLFVANHGLFGFEGGIIPSVVHEYTGKLPRLLTDSDVMLTRFQDTFMNLGMVLANRKVCSALMKAGESILVFPGGAREGVKRRGEQYKLFWEGRTGFVSMAIEQGFTITPVAAVGPDDMWDIRWDSDELVDTPVAWLSQRFFPDSYDPELLAPIPKGLFGTLLPRPERFFIAFGEPFDTCPYRGRESDTAVVNDIKQTLQTQLEELIKEALLERIRRRGDMHWLRRMLLKR